jgi:uridine kinase
LDSGQAGMTELVAIHEKMKQTELLNHLAGIILERQKPSPLIVGIDGLSASGKTTLADTLAQKLEESNRHVIQANMDGFHNPKAYRYRQGSTPEGYYQDSFNHKAIAQVLLEPLSSGNLNYKKAVFNYKIDSKVDSPEETAKTDSILIMEGVFLYRPEQVTYFDLKIFLDVDFDIIVQRALKRNRDLEYIGSEQDIINTYEKRYIPGQKLYLEEVNPKIIADVVVQNGDWENPVISR